MKQELDLDSPVAKYTVKMVVDISEQVPLEDPDKVLLVMILYTEDKVQAFEDWLITQTENGVIKATKNQIMHVASMIDRGEMPPMPSEAETK